MAAGRTDAKLPVYARVAVLSARFALFGCWDRTEFLLIAATFAKSARFPFRCRLSNAEKPRPARAQATSTLAIGLYAGSLHELAERAAGELADPSANVEAALGETAAWRDLQPEVTARA